MLYHSKGIRKNSLPQCLYAPVQLYNLIKEIGKKKKKTTKRNITYYLMVKVISMNKNTFLQLYILLSFQMALGQLETNFFFLIIIPLYMRYLE